MMLYDTKWYVPTTEYMVFVGGQQPDQQTSAPSNVLDGSFTVQAWTTSTNVTVLGYGCS